MRHRLHPSPRPSTTGDVYRDTRAPPKAPDIKIELGLPFLELIPGRDWLEEALTPVDMTYGGPLAEHPLLLLSEAWRTVLATVKAGVEIPDEWVEIGVAPDRNEDDGPLFSKVMIARRPGAPVSECRSNRIPAPKTFRDPYNQHWVSLTPSALILINRSRADLANED
jgi:hypothetical protein